MSGTGYRVGVVGASGYGGMELVRLLGRHTAVKITYLAASKESAQGYGDHYPWLYGLSDLPLRAFDADECAASCDIVFSALPSGVSGGIAAQLHSMGKVVVDLSGDLRLPSPLYEKWYPHSAVADSVFHQAVYGLTEWNRESLQGATLISNPGCYATAAELALLPVMKAGLDGPGSLIIDAKSGVSGAGRPPGWSNHLGELTDNMYAYKVGRHQHTPEIELSLQMFAKQERTVFLSTQLIPAVRGIYAVCYIPLKADVTAADVEHAFVDAYSDEGFVRVLGMGEVPQMKWVRGSNRCDIGVVYDERTGMASVTSVIDNLVKGAAGQAIQNMNVALGFQENAGLDISAVYP